MSILDKKNWWIWLILSILTLNISTLVVAALLDLYDKDAWYSNKRNWILGFLCFIFPGIIMFIVLIIQMLCKVSAKLTVPGKELYLSPYVWIIFLIVPIIGWVFLFVAILYLTIWYIIMIKNGEIEKYLK